MAEAFGLEHLDTGTLYRAVGLKMLETGGDPAELAESLSAEDLGRSDLRTPEAAHAASKVAAMPEVRAALLQFQRAFARRGGGAVLDGRDIGTVICPDAEVKLYVTASDDVRAQRRFAELQAKGMDVTLEGVAGDLARRDARDAGRGYGTDDGGRGRAFAGYVRSFHRGSYCQRNRLYPGTSGSLS